MSEKITSTAEFSAIWKAALKEFHANTSISLANEDGLLHLQNVDGLLEYLTKEHAQYDEDSASSKFTSVVKSTLGPLNFLLGTGGKVAGDVSQSSHACLFWALLIFADVSWWFASLVSAQHLCRGKSKIARYLTCLNLSHRFARQEELSPSLLKLWLSSSRESRTSPPG